MTTRRNLTLEELTHLAREEDENARASVHQFPIKSHAKTTTSTFSTRITRRTHHRTRRMVPHITRLLWGIALSKEILCVTQTTKENVYVSPGRFCLDEKSARCGCSQTPTSFSTTATRHGIFLQNVKLRCMNFQRL